jgi:aspartate kinase
LVTKTGISGRIFGIVGTARINIKMITQGAKELTIIMAVSNKDLGKTIVEIYDKLN